MTTQTHPAAAGGAPEPEGIDRELILLSSVVVLGTIMSILDTTIVNVALDALGHDLHGSLASVQWVATGYLLSLSMVIPLTGWGVERFGPRRLWMGSVVLFLVGSALSGMAWSMTTLIIFRVLQGIGGGMIMPVGQTILASAAGPRRMGRVMSVVGVPMMLGPILGPVLGGVLVQGASWRWIFYVNIPIGIAALILAARILPKQEIDERHPLDFLGLLLLSPGLAILVYGLSEATTGGGFGSSRTLAGIGVGLALVVAFLVRSAGLKAGALLDLSLFRDRAFTAGAATSFMVGVVLFGTMILLPLYYQVVRGEGAANAGLLMTPQGVGTAAMMPIAGRLTDRLGAGKVVPFGLIMLILGTVAYAEVGATTSYTLLAVSLLVRGVGMGFVMMPAMAAAYSRLDRSAVPRATTSLNIIQRVGGSIGTALMAVLLQRNITHNLPLPAGRSGGFGALGTIPPGVRTQVAPALAHAFAQTYWLSLVLTFVVFVPAFLLPMRAVHLEVTPGNAVPRGHPVGEAI
ncbi:MAG TPA: MDR family MFS transporter [Acidimicrobiales bacterium]|nr:MDR family MFS transporter [Acidimicrobiales bacterium]